MVERRSPIREKENCSVKGCSLEAERYVSSDMAEDIGMDIDDDIKRPHLCKEHYKQFKKESKLDRKLGNMGH